MCFDPFQHILEDLVNMHWRCTHKNESNTGCLPDIVMIDLGSGYVKGIVHPCQHGFQNTALFLERMSAGEIEFDCA